MRTFSTLVVAALAVAAEVRAIQNVTRSGRYLYTADGNRFFIKGVAYQQEGEVIESANNPFESPSTFTDPLANGTACQRDLTYLQQLGVNTIRAYSVDFSLDHDDCMSAFSGAGIYTIIDLSLPLNGSISNTDPTWTTALLDLYINTINVFSKYDNVLAYNVGNEVITSNTTAAATFVKAAARDTKAYLTSKGLSQLVGYASIDGEDDFRLSLAEYMSCDPSGSNSGSTALDLFGLNNYESCGPYVAGVYDDVNSQFENYNIPAYFSEFGCPPPGGGARTWGEVAAIFSSPMTNIWSGGLAFSYFPAESPQGEFGMVNISGNTVTPNADFDNLQTAYGQVSPPNSPSQGSSTAQYVACPSQSTDFAASTTLPPTPNDAACSCLETNLPCRFTPTTNNYTSILGTLIDTACGLLGQQGSNCNDIAANGTSGVYGRVSGCDPTIMLSYVMSEYYIATNRQATSCSFSGNGTVNSNAPSSAASSLAASCIASPSATFTPSAPSTTASGSGGSSSGGGGSGGSSHSGSGSIYSGVVGIAATIVIAVSSAVWTLL